MACTPTPTQTLFEVVTTSTFSTSTSEIVTTIPPELSTILTTFCGTETVDKNGTTTCVSTETSSIITTISSEQTKTIESQVILQIPVTTSLPTSTLFSTCPTPPPTSASQTNASLITTSSTSTLPDGSVIVTVITSTSTIIPTWALIPSESADHNNSDVQTNLATIIGSTVGGFFGLLLIVLIGWSIWRKRNSIRDLHLTDEMWSNDRSALHGRRKDIDDSIIDGQEPKPYQYGIVGRREQETTPSRRSSPNASPAPTRPQSLAHTSLSPGAIPGSGLYSPGSPPPHSAGLAPAPYIPEHILAFSSLPPAPNAQQQHVTSPYAAVPQAPASASLSPLSTGVAPALAPRHRPSDSVVSVGTAVSYPYQVPVPVVDREPHDDRAREDGGEDHGGATGVADPRLPKRMSLKLANWNPETDGEL